MNGGGNMNHIMKKHIVIGLLVICALIVSYLVYNQRANDKAALANTYIQINDGEYAFESLLGMTRNEAINILGKDYIVTDQGINQNIGFAYDEIGVLVGLDRKNEKVVAVQLEDVEYKGISTKLRMSTADDILDMEMLTINLMSNANQSPIWYVYDFGSYKVRISGQSGGSLIDELVIFKEDLQ
jgi:hypothetical protein